MQVLSNTVLHVQCYTLCGSKDRAVSPDPIKQSIMLKLEVSYLLENLHNPVISAL